MSAKRLYRAEAYYRQFDGESVIRRDFQTKRSRDEWARKRREGFEMPSVDLYEGPIQVPAALRVEMSQSEPVEWPTEPVPGTRQTEFALGDRVRFNHVVSKQHRRDTVTIDGRTVTGDWTRWLVYPQTNRVEPVWEEGIVCGRRSVAEGTTQREYHGEPQTFTQRRRITVYLVAQNLDLKPAHVLAEHMELLP